MAYFDKYGVEFSDDRKTLIKCPEGLEGSYVIPNGVTSIRWKAFSCCSRLTSVDIPDSVTSIGYRAFIPCANLNSINIENNNPDYSSLGGVLFNKDTTKLILYPAGKKGAYAIHNWVTSIGDEAFCGCNGLTSVAIPNSVTSIGNEAFAYCSGLASVEIPNSVTSIGWKAFSCCSRLTSVTIPDSVTSIGYRAFCGCSSLTSVTIGNNVTSIESGTFSGCDRLTSIEIPNSVTSIGPEAFEGCNVLTSIEIPNSTTEIGFRAFMLCTRLNSISIENNNPNYSSLDGVLFNKNKTKLIQYPLDRKGAYTIPNSVTSIGAEAFGGCHGLTSVTIGNSVTSIEVGAFSGCDGLTSVTIGNSVTSIGAFAFYGCDGLTSVTIGNSVTSIGGGAFVLCESLQEIIVPIGQKARFSQMEGLKNLKDIIVERDDEELIVLFNFGKAYELGIGVTKSVAQAILFYVQSAEKGCADAAYHLGEWYRDGRNVPHDNEKALFYFQQAAKSAFSDAGKQVKILEEAIENKEKEKKLMTEEYEKIKPEKPYYLFFDTETTGVPRNYRAPMQDTANWPRLVQLAWLLVDEKGTELKRKSVIIRPDGFSIPEETVRVHGITTERAQKEGLPLRNVLDEFMQDLELAEEIVGHNIDFDIHIVGAELCRLGLSTQTINNKPATCTMKSFTDYCAIPSNNGYGGYKWPTLEELYYKVFGCGMENAHDALADILATKECFFELKNQFKAKASSVPMSGKRTDLSDLPF